MKDENVIGYAETLLFLFFEHIFELSKSQTKASI